MIFQENFRFFDFWDAIESGLYFVIVGYYFLLFAYFLLMRFRTSKKLYWLFFSLLFLCLAAGRVFFIAYYFFLPELKAPPAVIAGYLMLTYRLATFFTWLAIACLMGVLGMLIWPPESVSSKESSEKFMLSSSIKISLRIILIAIPIFIGILALTLPDSLFMDPEIAERYDLDITIHKIYGYPTGRFLLNFILAPIFMAAIPFLFLYLALKTFGVLRKSYLLNAIGFFLYYAGRILQGVFEVAGWPHLRATVPPLIILCSLLIIVIANNFEQLR
jgi:hypothetical protein